MSRVFELLEQHSGIRVLGLDQCHKIARAWKPRQWLPEVPKIVGDQHSIAYKANSPRHSLRDKNADTHAAECGVKVEDLFVCVLGNKAAIELTREL